MTLPTSKTKAEERIVVLAPWGRDALLIREVLAKAGLSCTSCGTIHELGEELRGGAAAILLTEEALAAQTVKLLKEALAAQPPWSDLPLVILVDDDPQNPAGLRAVQALGRDRGATILTRPVGIPTLVTVMQAALRARHKQYEVRDLLIQLEAANERLQHNALHDGLTGLHNRAYFMERLAQVTARYQRRADSSFIVLFIDLDRFKLVNDSLGPALGDALLVTVGQRLALCLRPTDTLARMGGDEFTVLLEDIHDLAKATLVAKRIQEALLRPVALEGRQVSISASIGIAPCASHHHSPEDVLRDADIAMYSAKMLGGARFQIFDPEMRQQAQFNINLESDLRIAIAKSELRVYYQPIMSLDSGRLVGFEALLRWQHPSYGLMPPGNFLQVAEDSGIILELDLWVLRQACQQLAHWSAQFPNIPPLMLSVNLSGLQFLRPSLVAEIRHALEDTGLDPYCLKLELTERVLLGATAAVKVTLEQLKALGLQIYLDDFGTGYASLAYLRDLPIDLLKIDRTFVAQMAARPESAELVRTIVTMASNLGLEVIAEGVETEAQLAQLEALGVRYAQGFLFAAPLYALEAAALARR